MASTSRKIYYFQAAAAGDVRFSDMVKQVCRLEMSDRTILHEGQQVIVHLFRQQDILAGVVTILREEGLPAIGRRNSIDIRDIELAEEEGILEASHFVIMPDAEIVLFEYNHYGPKVGLFFHAINTIYRERFEPNAPGADWAYISRRDGYERLGDMAGVSGLQISMTNLQLSNAGSYNETLESLEHLGDWRTANIELKPEPHSRTIILSIAEFVRKFFPHGQQDLQNYEKCRVKAINATGGVETIDLLADKVTSQFSVTRLGRSRQINTSDLLSKMQEDVADYARRQRITTQA
ncbi:MAG TPA: hypothetical protein VLA88_05745 [Candidatus Saccharimonadales bacterium]|nr:hypothetical protein [Candidatus Saccharimonadales bacterium]